MATTRDLFETHHLAVFRFLKRMCGNHEAAEDLLQETFLRVARARSEYREEGREKAWLFRIARNVFLNRRRDEARRPSPEELPDATVALGSSRPVIKIGLEQALSRLGDDYREAFLLREVGGLGYHEIASVSGTSPDAVRNRIYRARMELRLILADGRAGTVRRFPKEKTS